MHIESTSMSVVFRKIELCSLLCNISKYNSAAHSGVVSAYINH